MKLATLFQTDRSWVTFALRVVVGLVILPHGLQKLVGAFGGYGFDGTMGFLTGQVGLPWIVAFLVIAIESFGALALLAGLLTRPAALGLIAVMVGAVVTTHLPHGFFMNWTGAQGGEGFEYHLLVVGIAAALTVFGGGRWSLDRLVAARLERGAERREHAYEPVAAE